MENELLRQLNSELQSRNQNFFSNEVASYANITKGPVKTNEKVTKILVKAKNINNKAETLEMVKTKLTSDLALPINKVN